MDFQWIYKQWVVTSENFEGINPMGLNKPWVGSIDMIALYSVKNQ